MQDQDVYDFYIVVKDVYANDHQLNLDLHQVQLMLLFVLHLVELNFELTEQKIFI